MAEFEKKTAYKVAIGPLKKGAFVRRDGWEPSFIKGVDDLEISRVNIIALAVALENGESETPSLILDDGTGKIEARSFPGGLKFQDIEVGNLVQVIGRPREYNKEIYITPEIVKPLTDPKWAEVRKKELDGESIVLEEEEPSPTTTGQTPAVETESVEEDIEEEDAPAPSQKIYNLIKELDSGEGADVDKVIETSKEPDAEKIISTLLMEGDIFEVKNGRVKVLE